MSNGQPQSVNGDGDEVDDSLPGAGAETSTESEYITRADFEAFTQSMVDKISRQVQSRTDQADHRLQQRFQSLAVPYQRAADQAVVAGFIKPDQKDAYARHLRDDAMQQAMSGPAGVGETETETDEGEVDEAPPGPAVAQVNQQGETLMRNLGLAEGDPELAAIIIDGSPEEFYGSIKAAARLKQIRTAQGGAGQGSALSQPARAAPAGRSPGVGAGGGRPANTNPVENIESSEALYDLAWKNVKSKGR